MVASRQRPKGAFAAPFGLGMLAVVLAPSGMGPQDLAISHARKPPLAERERAPVPTARGATHLDLLHRSRAAIAAVPTAVGYTLASVGPSNGDITGTFRGQERIEAELDRVTGLIREPTINRQRKGE